MLDFFLDAYKNATAAQIILEAMAFASGIASVWLAKKENIWVYPTGLIATVITTYLLLAAQYYGDAIVNAYFSIMSIYGWYAWGKGGDNKTSLPVSRTNHKEKLTGIVLFFMTIFVVFAIYKVSGKIIETDNYIDILSSGIFFTAMWYMAHKKIENWTLWIAGDSIVTPLYAYRGLGMLSLQYLIFTILAVMAYLEWRKILNSSRPQL